MDPPRRPLPPAAGRREEERQEVTTTHTTEVRRIRRDSDAEAVARAVYEDLLRLLVTLATADWEAVTDCAPWTVADVVRHMVGAAKGHASLREEVRQFRYAAGHAHLFDGSRLDAMNDLHVQDHAHLDGPALIGELDRVWSDAVAGRMSRPAVMRMLRVPNDTTGSMPSGNGGRVRLGHLFDTILTRDVWLHRIDIARATGRALTYAAHDRRIISDVIAEWAERLGTRGFDLTITGPFEARFVSGDGAETLELDGVELCRILSGRAQHPSPLFETKVLF